MVNYSIIIPHKNSLQLLDRLLLTIPHRDDLEILVIDDNSENISDWLPGNDRSDIRWFFLKENHGAGYARNVGIDNSKGKWLMFADADDFFSDKLYHFFNKYVDDISHDMVILNAMGYDEKGVLIPIKVNMYVKNYINKRLYSEKVIRFGLWTPWSRMVKREVIEKYQIRFENIPTGNDVMFGLNCSKFCTSIAVEESIIYYYQLPVGRSLTNKYRWSLSSLAPRLELSFRCLALYKEVNYIFKPFHIIDYCKPTIRKKEKEAYRLMYRNILKKHNYKLKEDVTYFFIYCLGRLFKII